MTGEMHVSEVTRDNYPLHFALADAFNGTVLPFDQYQGPYVRTDAGAKLWISSEDGIVACVWNEQTDIGSSGFLPDMPTAIQDVVDCAKETLQQKA